MSKNIDVRSLIGAPKVLPVLPIRMQSATVGNKDLSELTRLSHYRIGGEDFDLARAASVIRLMAKELEQRRNVGEWVVTVSTAYMKESDSEKLCALAWVNPDHLIHDESAGNRIFWINAMPGGYLLRLSVAGDWECSLDVAGLSEGFIENCRALVVAGYTEIHFDVDGDMVDGLLSWDW